VTQQPESGVAEKQRKRGIDRRKKARWGRVPQSADSVRNDRMEVYLSWRIKSEADLAAFFISVRLCSPLEEPVTCSARRSALAVMTQSRLLRA